MKALLFVIMMGSVDFSATGSFMSVNVGFIIEGDSTVERKALKIAVANANNILEPDIRIVTREMRIRKAQSHQIDKEVCNLAKMGMVALVTATSCPAQMVIQSRAEDLHLPTLQVGSSYCGNPRISGDFYFSTIPDEELIFRPLVKYLADTNVKNLVICYQQGYAASTLQRMITTKMMSRSYDVVTNVVEITPKIDWVNFAGSDLSRQISNFLSRSEDSKIDAFVVLASPHATVQLILKTDRPVHWIVANQAFRAGDSKKLENSLQSAVTVIRLNSDSNDALVKTFVTEWNKESSKTCEKCDAVRIGDIPITALYLFDGIAQLAQGLKSMQEGDSWHSGVPLTCGSNETWAGGRYLIDAMKEANSSGLLGAVRLNQRGYRNFANFAVTEKANGGSFKTIANWQPDMTGRSEEGRSWGGISASTDRVLRVAAALDSPFVIKSDSNKLEGFAVDMLSALALECNFEYQIYAVDRGEFEYPDMNGSRYGLTQEILSRKADLAIGALSITSSQLRSVDFTTRFMDSSLAVAIKKTPNVPKLLFFTDLFDSSVWICIGASIVIVGIMTFILNHVGPEKNKSSSSVCEKLSFADSVWFTFRGLMHRGNEAVSMSWPLRIISGFWWFFALVVALTYAANLTAVITISRMSERFRNLEDVLDAKGFEIGTLVNSTIYNTIKRRGLNALDQMSIYYKLWIAISSSTTVIKSVENGLRLANDGKFAFLWDASILDYQVQSSPYCDLMTVKGNLNFGGYGIALPQRSALVGDFNNAIIDMSESGEMARLISKWWQNSGYCQSSNADRTTALTLQDFAVIFCILAAGVLLASIASAVEFFYSVARGRREKNPRRGAHDDDPRSRPLLIKSKQESHDEDILVVLKRDDILKYLQNQDKLESHTRAVEIKEIGRDTKVNEQLQQEDSTEVRNEIASTSRRESSAGDFRGICMTRNKESTACRTIPEHASLNHQAILTNNDNDKYSMPDLTSQYPRYDTSASRLGIFKNCSSKTGSTITLPVAFRLSDDAKPPGWRQRSLIQSPAMRSMSSQYSCRSEASHWWATTTNERSSMDEADVRQDMTSNDQKQVQYSRHCEKSTTDTFPRRISSTKPEDQAFGTWSGRNQTLPTVRSQGLSKCRHIYTASTVSTPTRPPIRSQRYIPILKKTAV